MIVAGGGKKGSNLNIKGGPQESDEKALNVLLFGASGSGKSSLINYLAGKPLAPVGHSGISCTKVNTFYEVTLLNKNSGFSTPRASTTPEVLWTRTGMWPQESKSS